MHNKILSTALIGLVASTTIQASTLDKITITTATKTEKSIDGVTASVVVITEKDIEKTGASTLDKILQKIPSINAQYGRFPHPSSSSKASISLRGMGSNGTLILIDGKRLSGETESPYEMTRITSSMIERIEIVKGSMSTLYGSDAIGGVINIITKKIDKNVTTLDLKYGSNSDGEAINKNANLTNRGRVGKFKYKINASIDDTTPYTENKSYTQQAINPSSGADLDSHALDNTSGNYNVTYKDESTVKTIGTRLEYDFTDNFNAGFDLNYFTENREGQYLGNAASSLGGLITNTPVNSEDKNRRIDVSSDFNYIINDDLSMNTKLYRSYYKKRNYTDPLTFDGSTNTKFSANVTIDTLESGLIYILNDSNIITTGLEYRKETRDSGAINPIASSSEFVTKIVKYKSLFIQDEIEFSDTLNAIIGARYDNISNADNKITLQAGLVKNLTDNTSIRANYAQGYRTPDIAELYVNSMYYKGAKRYGAEVINTIKTEAYDLKPEQSQTFELSLSNKYKNLSSTFTIFNNKVKDKIDLVSYNDSNSSTKYYTSENIDKVDIKGAEVSFDYSLNKNIDFGINATYLKTEDESTGKELTYTPDISASFNTNYKITDAFNTNLMLRYIGKQFTNSTNTEEANAYTLVDLGAQYQINKNIEYYIGIDNIFNKEVDEEIGTNVGTYYFTGLRMTF
ncbi:TonB-dependent receptor plug domain-containing protein [Arcobacter peruensis]|uniref:TonB-dependent receptor plug domain-containing protein n=1 Tax=Arcobacter peruensis TaxID=2320140 RepID=UPI000F0974AB|nr:TonB-dependent receptor [Arcobacter peruensis]